MIETSLATAAGGLRARRRDRFFLGMSGALLLILLIGFSPTLYLRLFFDVRPIPFYLHVHGATVTAWFVVLLLQATLVSVNRIDVHRRIGIAGALLGVAVIPAGLMATLNVVGRLPEMGFELEPVIYFFSWVVWANFLTLFSFIAFLATALVLRSRTDFHKRLMLLAGMSLMGPPLARISGMFGWALEAEIVFVTVIGLLLLVPMILHDVVVQKRTHRATALGGLCYVLVVLAPVVIGRTEFAQQFVRGLA